MRLSRALSLGLALLLALAVHPAPVPGQSLCPGLVRDVIPYAQEQLTIGAASTPLTAAVYLPSGNPSFTPVMAIGVLETAAIRYWDTGAVPTAAEGQPATPPVTLVICESSISAWRGIRTTGSSGVLNLVYYRRR